MSNKSIGFSFRKSKWMEWSWYCFCYYPVILYPFRGGECGQHVLNTRCQFWSKRYIYLHTLDSYFASAFSGFSNWFWYKVALHMSTCGGSVMSLDPPPPWPTVLAHAACHHVFKSNFLVSWGGVTGGSLCQCLFDLLKQVFRPHGYRKKFEDMQVELLW